jgi:hypothetical protein
MTTSTTFFDLPTPLLDLIYEFSGNQKQLKSQTEQELLFNISMGIFNDYKRQVMNRRHHPGSKYFGVRHLLGIIVHNNCDNLEKKQHFNNLNNCNCCTRHKRNTPMTITDTWDEDPIMYMENITKMEKKNCKCKCRHYKRIIAGTYKPDAYIDGYFSTLID